MGLEPMLFSNQTMAHTNYFNINFPPTLIGLFHVLLGKVIKDIEDMDEMGNEGATCSTTFTEVKISLLSHDNIA